MAMVVWSGGETSSLPRMRKTNNQSVVCDNKIGAMKEERRNLPYRRHVYDGFCVEQSNKKQESNNRIVPGAATYNLSVAIVHRSSVSNKDEEACWFPYSWLRISFVMSQSDRVGAFCYCSVAYWLSPRSRLYFKSDQKPREYLTRRR